MDLHLKRQTHRVGKPGQKDRRSNARGIGHGVGIGRDAFADRGARQRHAGDVARRNHERETERGFTIVVGEWSDQRQTNACFFAGHQVADPQREHAGPFLFGDGRAATFALGLVVFLAGGCPFFQRPFNDAAGDFHAEMRHRGAVGQREDVGRLEWLALGVDESLGQHGFGGQTVDPRAHIDGTQG